MDFVKARLLDEELKIKGNAHSLPDETSIKANQDGGCYQCGDKTHFKINCPKLIGANNYRNRGGRSYRGQSNRSQGYRAEGTLPTTFKEAKQFQDSTEAIEKELKAHEEPKTWTPQDLPDGEVASSYNESSCILKEDNMDFSVRPSEVSAKRKISNQIGEHFMETTYSFEQAKLNSSIEANSVLD
ncbi:unnamed protein product [Nezara viridula]|uniref:CCHC-type domain-containing protein n=1 Tax=Nezara viridula TaxID=85310 RepID=A0A9P0EFL2_NEZVI|nr:unnamed protein product [Nezara viridula]